MYRKIVWCYVLVLILLDISLNTKLTAQGKSHDVTVHDSLIEGISFQEWGKDADESAVGPSAAAEALRLSPAALRFGRAALGAAHALTVTLTNTHNATVHLASVAGTTPDFHSSFFESKTLPPNGNTSFSVVYLGRREGPVSAHIYIHTSLGVHKYPVSAEGVASEWGVWPLVGLRVPHNATLDPVLTLYNPTDKPIQVSEVYSSGSWVGLRLPDGGGAAPRSAWLVPAHSARALVRLQLRLPPAPPAAHAHAHAHQHTRRALTAYIRIRGKDVGADGGGLVVAVEATAAAPGAFLLPPQIRLRARGSRDPPHTFDISAGNSGATPVRVEASLWSRCGPHPLPPPADDDADADARTHNGQLDRATANGVKSEGAHLAVLRPQLDAFQEPTETLQLTLDYARLWASYAGSESDDGADSGDSSRTDGLWCGGVVRLGAGAVPYSLRLLPGTLRLTPPRLEVVTASREDALMEREISVRNEFPVHVLVGGLDRGGEADEHFHIVDLTPVVLAPGESAPVCRLRLRAASWRAQVAAELRVRTNHTRLALPVLVHDGALRLEWDWPNSSDGNLRVGAVGASSTRRIGVQLHNPTPATLCVSEHSLQLPAAQFTLPALRCIPGGSRAQAWLTVVAPARAGALAGSLRVSTPHASARAAVSLHAHAGNVLAPPLRLTHAAPYAWGAAPLLLESSMALRMRVLNVTQPRPDPALSFVPAGSGWVAAGAGRQAVGAVHYAPERACAPRCYTGLDLDTPEGASWLSRAQLSIPEIRASLHEDVSLLRARRALFTPHSVNVSLYVHTSEVVQIPVTGTVRLEWPRLTQGGGAWAGGALLAGVGGAATARVLVRNPAAAPLLLQPVFTHHHLHHRPGDAAVHPPHHDPDHLLHPLDVEGMESFCKKNKCVWSSEAFSISSWEAATEAEAAAGVAQWARGNASHAPLLLLAPGAAAALAVALAPAAPAPLAAHLCLRNNLTIVEIIPIWGRGAYPSFELGGRRPGSTSPLLFEVSECGEAGGGSGGGSGGGAGVGGGAGGAGGGVVRRTVSVHNTGEVPLKLRDWRIAGQPCQARGFRLQPCAPLTLAPNETRALRFAFAADYTLARVAAALTVRSDTQRFEFTLQAHVPAKLLRACATHAPRPPFEPALRAAGTLLALAALGFTKTIPSRPLIITSTIFAFAADYTLARVVASLTVRSDTQRFEFTLQAHVPAKLLRACAVHAPRPPFEPALRAAGTLLALAALALVLAAAALDAERELRRARAARTITPPPTRTPLDLRAVSTAPVVTPTPARPAPPRRRRAARRPAPLDPAAERRAFERWRAEVLRREDDDHSTSEEADVSPLVETVEPEIRDSSPSPPSPTERRSSDEDNASASAESSVGSDSSRGASDELGHDSDSGAGDPPCAEPVVEARPRRVPTDTDSNRADDATISSRTRREARDLPRRSERREEGARRSTPARSHARREKAARRRERAPGAATPPRPGAPPPPEARAPAAVRWDTTWSSVVAAGAAATHNATSNGAGNAPLPPIGSDVRRRADTDRPPSTATATPPATSGGAGGDHSLFYFNGDAAPAHAWRASPPLDRPAFPHPHPHPQQAHHNEYRNEYDDNSSMNAYGSLWTGPGSSAWAWGGGFAGVRPPPGFAAPPPAPRAYDPFRSLAAIWAPGALDWREPDPAAPAPASPADASSPDAKASRSVVSKTE